MTLDRAARPSRRVALDLPGTPDLELAGFEVAVDAELLRAGALPDWAWATVVLRSGQVLEPAAAGVLQPGDYVSILAPSVRVRELERQLEPAKAGGPARSRSAEFPIRGDAPLAALADAYGLALPRRLRGLTVATLYAAEFEGEPLPGDRVRLGPALLIAHATDGPEVRLAWLVLEDPQPPEAGRGVLGWVERVVRLGRERSAG